VQESTNHRSAVCARRSGREALKSAKSGTFPLKINMRKLVTINVRPSGVAIVSLNRADKFNGLSLPMFKEIERAALAVSSNPSIRAVILTGSGRGFCAGLDVPSIVWSGPAAPRELLARAQGRVDNLAQAVGFLWRQLRVPVFAAIHGVCFGGGLQIALGADMRFATAEAKMSIMEGKWGLIPDMSGSVTLRELVPMAVVKQLSWTAEVFSGERAAAMGLVSQLSSDPLQAATTYAESLRLDSAEAAAACKQCMLDDRAARFSLVSTSKRSRDSSDPTLSNAAVPRIDAPKPHVSIADGVATLTLTSVESDVLAACGQLAADASVRVLLLLFDEDSSAVDGRHGAGAAATVASDALRRLPMPVIAVLTKPLTPHASVASLGADVRIGSAGAAFRFDVAREAHAHLGTLLRLSELGGTAAAAKASAGGWTVGAQEAASLGLLALDEVDAQARAAKLAAQISARSPVCVSGVKELFQSTWHADEPSSLATECRIQSAILPSGYPSWNVISCAATNLVLPRWLGLPFSPRVHMDLLPLAQSPPQAAAAARL
jgi:enoyl-CoA hydratase/carnithine racemase